VAPVPSSFPMRSGEWATASATRARSFAASVSICRCPFSCRMSRRTSVTRSWRPTSRFMPHSVRRESPPRTRIASNARQPSMPARPRPDPHLRLLRVVEPYCEALRASIARHCRSPSGFSGALAPGSRTAVREEGVREATQALRSPQRSQLSRTLAIRNGQTCLMPQTLRRPAAHFLAPGSEYEPRLPDCKGASRLDRCSHHRVRLPPLACYHMQVAIPRQGSAAAPTSFRVWV